MATQNGNGTLTNKALTMLALQTANTELTINFGNFFISDNTEAVTYDGLTKRQDPTYTFNEMLEDDLSSFISSSGNNLSGASAHSNEVGISGDIVTMPILCQMPINSVAYPINAQSIYVCATIRKYMRNTGAIANGTDVIILNGNYVYDLNVGDYLGITSNIEAGYEDFRIKAITYDPVTTMTTITLETLLGGVASYVGDSENYARVFTGFTNAVYDNPNCDYYVFYTGCLMYDDVLPETLMSITLLSGMNNNFNVSLQYETYTGHIVDIDFLETAVAEIDVHNNDLGAHFDMKAVDMLNTARTRQDIRVIEDRLSDAGI